MLVGRSIRDQRQSAPYFATNAHLFHLAAQGAHSREPVDGGGNGHSHDMQRRPAIFSWKARSSAACAAASPIAQISSIRASERGLRGASVCQSRIKQPWSEHSLEWAASEHNSHPHAWVQQSRIGQSTGKGTPYFAANAHLVFLLVCVVRCGYLACTRASMRAFSAG